MAIPFKLDRVIASALIEQVNPALDVLTGMITPAVLISACGTMILSTSTRLGRVVDRVRVLSDRLEELSRGKPDVELFEERRVIIFDQLGKLTGRSRLLQRSMTAFYMALGIFVFTSVAIGLVGISGSRYNWIPVVFGLIGACFLLYGSVLLIWEARLALNTISTEMDFLRRLGKRHAASEIVEPQCP